MSVASIMRRFWLRILWGTGGFEGRAGMSKVDASGGVIRQGLCRVRGIFSK